MSMIHERIEDLRAEIRKPEMSPERVRQMWKKFEIDWWYFCQDLEEKELENEGDE